MLGSNAVWAFVALAVTLNTLPGDAGAVSGLDAKDKTYPGDLDVFDDDLSDKRRALPAALSTHQLQLLDGSVILRTVEAVRQNIDDQAVKANGALAAAIAAALAAATAAADGIVLTWTAGVQAVLQRAGALNATLTQCRAQQESLQTVSNSLYADVQACVRQASASGQTALQGLNALQPQAQALVNQVSQDVRDCSLQGGPLASGWCLAGRIPGRLQQAGLLAARATSLAAQVGANLIAVPVQSATCVGGATSRRGAEAATVINNIRQCVNNNINNNGTLVTTAAVGK